MMFNWTIFHDEDNKMHADVSEHSLLQLLEHIIQLE